MRRTGIRQPAIGIVAAVLVALLVLAATSRGVGGAQFLLAAAACVFVYIVYRLSDAMFASSATARRRARLGLLVASAVPVLVLTAAALWALPINDSAMTLLGAVVWLGLSLSFTSFALARLHQVFPASRMVAVPLATRPTLLHLSTILIARGLVIALVGAITVFAPEDVGISTLSAVAIAAVLGGVYEGILSTEIREQLACWWLMLADGIAMILFGVLTVTAPALAFMPAVLAAATWFLVYAALAFGAAVAAWPYHGIRDLLLAVGAVSVAFAALCVAYPEGTVLALLSFGALFAVVFGAWQIGIGVWIRRHTRERRRSRAGVRIA